jgi:hypothetical protein
MYIRDGVLKVFLCLLIYSPLANFNQTKEFEAIEGYQVALTTNVLVNRKFWGVRDHIEERWGAGGTVRGRGGGVRLFLDAMYVPSVCCYQPLVVRGTSVW